MSLGRTIVFCSFALALLMNAAGCEQKGCDLVGCYDGASLNGQTASTLNQVSIELCVNDVCQSATTDKPTVSCTIVGKTVGIQGSPAQGNVCFLQADGSSGWDVSGYVVVAGARDGDRYVLTITDDQTGVVLGEADVQAHYSDFHPNGPDCPGTCKGAKVKVEPP